MPKFRKKPIIVNAAPMEGHPFVEFGFGVPGAPSHAVVLGKQGWVNVNPGDWIIEEQDGSGHYPCAPDVFAATYEPVEGN